MQEVTNQGNELLKFENIKQKRIYNNLYELIGPAPAAFYQDACHVMKNSSEFNTASHIVAHQLREIEGFLFDALSVIPNEKPGSIDLSDLKTDLLEIAGSIPDRAEGFSKFEIDAILIELEKQLNDKLKLISRKRFYRKKGDKALSILDGLQIRDKGPILNAWLVELQGHAHRRYLDAPRKVDDGFKKIFEEKEKLFDIILQALRNRYLIYIQRLDDLLCKSDPTNEDINLLRKNIPSNLLTRSYFFSRLNKASWLKPLRKAGFFKIHPIPVINDENGSVTAFAWPESKYLTLMSRSEPEEVSDIILNEVPYVENEWVLEDFIDALIQMPPGIACKTVDRLIDWSRSMYPLLLPEKLWLLIVHLAKYGKIEHALRLAKASLEVMPDPRNKKYSIDKGEYQLPPEPQSRFDPYDFKNILNEGFPEFIEIAGSKAFDLLCEMLESAILLSQRTADEGIKDISYAILGRPNIERGSGYRDTPKDILIDAVISAANQIAKTDESQVPALVQVIDARPYNVFKRIASHIMREYPKTTQNLIAIYLNEKDKLNEVGIVSEFTQLLKENYKNLSPSQQEIILKWILYGPDLDKYKNSMEKNYGKRPNDEEALVYRKKWQRDRFALIVLDLPMDLNIFYEDLVKEMGKPRLLDASPCEVYHRMGSTSPIDTKTLKGMSTNSIIEFLKSWKDVDNFYGPSREGLYAVLKETILEEPDRFAIQATEFKCLDLLYIQALFMGLNDAVVLGRNFDWSQVICLCKEILFEYRQIKDDPNSSDLKVICHNITMLISSGLEDTKERIPFDLRHDIWSIIEMLLILIVDSDQTLAEEAKYIGSEPIGNSSISFELTPQIEIIMAVIKYGFWVQKCLEKSSDVCDKSANRLDVIPEVRRVLDRYLDLDMDSCLSIRAVYGMQFPLLYSLDNSWALNNIKTIFPLEELKRPQFEAAWRAYLMFCPPELEIFKILESRYFAEVERLKFIMKDFGQFECKLAEHLMVFYWCGMLKIDEPKSIFLQFWDNAPEGLREYALKFVGFSLTNSEVNIHPNILKRLINLWEFRFNVMSKSNSTKNELRSFSWWFSSNKFDIKWTLDQFRESLNLIDDFSNDFLVVNKLEKLSSEMPNESIKCLDLIIRKIKNKFRIHTWRKIARVIIQNAIDSEDVESIRVAKELINYLVSIRYLEFRDMLNAD